MAKRKLFYAALTDSVVERTASHLGAQRAGVILLADIKNYFLDVCFKAGVGNFKLGAELTSPS